MTVHPLGTLLRAALIGALCCAVLRPGHADTLYRWVDERGRVTYSQQPPPAGAARKVQKRQFADGPVVDDSLPYAARVAAEQFPVTLFTTPDCGSTCGAARDSLLQRGIPFREVSVKDAEAFETLKALSARGEVPLLQVGREVLTTYEPVGWQRALDNAGYPASITRRAALQQGTGKPSERPAVKLFTARDCGEYCDAARRMLQDRGIAFEEVTVADTETETEMKKLFQDAALPALAVGTERKSGFDSQRYSDMLDSAGFAKAGAAQGR